MTFLYASAALWFALQGLNAISAPKLLKTICHWGLAVFGVVAVLALGAEPLRDIIAFGQRAVG